MQDERYDPAPMKGFGMAPVKGEGTIIPYDDYGPPLTRWQHLRERIAFRWGRLKAWVAWRLP